MAGSTAPVTVDTELLSEVLLVKVTKAQKRFVERQARLELRTMGNWVRTLIVEKQQG